MKPEQAKIRIVESIKVVGHPCKACEWDNPPVIFKGVIGDKWIEWPIYAGYHISYCPHCGMKLPITMAKGGAS